MSHCTNSNSGTLFNREFLSNLPLDKLSKTIMSQSPEVIMAFTNELPMKPAPSGMSNFCIAWNYVVVPVWYPNENEIYDLSPSMLFQISKWSRNKDFQKC
jgi:hypothetical protein